MKLYLDTSTSDTVLKLDEKLYVESLGRDTAEKIFSFIHSALEENDKDWIDITEITFMSGPGSFTGLRIGAAVVNALADQLGVPLHNHRGEKVPLILPDYGREANISKPRK